MKTPKVILRIETSRICGRGIVLGISKYCNLFGRWHLSQKPPFYLQPRHAYDDPNLPDNWFADGMIVSLPEIPPQIRELGVPIIGIDIREPIANLPNIGARPEPIAELAVEHFRERGFFHCGYVTFAGIQWALDRGEHFCTLAGAHGLEVSRYCIQETRGSFTWEEQLFGIGEWLKQLPRPAAVFACNDDCAKLVSSACETVEIRVPDDVAILGVDNDEMVCLPNNPPLSSVALDFEKAGFEAAALLDKIMRRQEPLAAQQIDVHPTYVETRASTDVMATNDSEVSLALGFIRENIHDAIAVPDVVEATTISRRGLEYRFKKAVGRSINHIIRQQRVALISRMLMETNLSISQIAHRLGFTDAEHIARYFRSVKKMSPSEFRNRYGSI